MLTLEECREKLGKKGDKLTDKQVLAIRDLLFNMCIRIIDQVILDKK